MNKCSRCGFSWTDEQLKPTLEGWPKSLLKPPPLPDLTSPHPQDDCPSHVKIGEKIFWDLGELAPDLPPIRGTFLELDRFEGPDYLLVENKWVKVGNRVAYGFIEIDKSSVHPDIKEYFSDVLEPDKISVLMDDIASDTKWPVVMLD